MHDKFTGVRTVVIIDLIEVKVSQELFCDGPCDTPSPSMVLCGQGADVVVVVVIVIVVDISLILVVVERMMLVAVQELCLLVEMFESNAVIVTVVLAGV